MERIDLDSVSEESYEVLGAPPSGGAPFDLDELKEDIKCLKDTLMLTQLDFHSIKNDMQSVKTDAHSLKSVISQLVDDTASLRDQLREIKNERDVLCSGVVLRQDSDFRFACEQMKQWYNTFIATWWPEIRLRANVFFKNSKQRRIAETLIVILLALMIIGFTRGPCTGHHSLNKITKDLTEYQRKMLELGRELQISSTDVYWLSMENQRLNDSLTVLRGERDRLHQQITFAQALQSLSEYFVKDQRRETLVWMNEADRLNSEAQELAKEVDRLEALLIGVRVSNRRADAERTVYLNAVIKELEEAKIENSKLRIEKDKIEQTVSLLVEKAAMAEARARSLEQVVNSLVEESAFNEARADASWEGYMNHIY